MIEERQVTIFFDANYFALYPNAFSPEEVKDRMAFRKQYNEQKAKEAKPNEEEKKVEKSKKDEVVSESEDDSD